MGTKYKPQIRFRGFSEGWLSCKFKDILISHGSKQYLADPLITGEYPVVQQGDNPIVGFSNKQPFVNYKDVILFGDHTLSLYLPKMPFLIATDGIKVLSINGFPGAFLYSFVEKYRPNSEGYKRHFNILKNSNAYYPLSDEKKYIGDFFSKLDNTISLHQQELDTLKQTKQGFLQKMFPKEGESVPEVRFPGFNGNWEQKKLEDILKSHGYKTYLANPFPTGKYHVIQQGENPILGFSNETPFTNYEDVVLFGDHTLSLFKPETPFLVATDGIKILSANGFTGYFLYSLLENYLPDSQGYKRHYTILKNVFVSYPAHKEEQEKIGVFFKKFDQTIKLHEKELEALKETKKAFLQKMFV